MTGRLYQRRTVSWAGRLGAVALLALASTGLASCGGPEFDKAFNQSFDKSTHDSCVSSAIAHQASSDVAERYCTCFVSQLQGLSVQEKMNLSRTPEKMTNAAAFCRAQVQ
jgi:hypothetical protein